jgi:integrase/recombinase XerD
MRRNIYVTDLCSEFEQLLIKQQIGVDSLKRYRKVITEFSVINCNNYYSQSLGTVFLLSKFRERGGLVLSDEESKNEQYYFRCIRMLAEYFNFGIILKRSDVYGEIIWPAGFRDCTESFYSALVDDGLSYGYVANSRKVIKEFILFLDADGIHEPADIRVEHNDKFIQSYCWMSPKGIETKLCMLRRYYRYLFLNQYICLPLAERLPHASIQGRMKFPIVWNTEQIEKIKTSADRTSPSGKRSFAMIMISAELGLRIGDIRNLKLQDIDWNKKQISIIQHKTDKALLLPLSDDVGWAIIDYLRNGRPYTDSPNVFVKHRPPYDAFPINSTMNHILSIVMNKAGIPPEMKKNVGWHTFRRSLATNLLQNNVEMTTISEILGHSDPDIAGRYYVKLDVENLRKCTLSMEVKDYVRK